MPSKSQAQARMMQAVAHSPSFAKKVGIPQSVGKDYFAADKKSGTSGLPVHKAGGGRITSNHPKELKMKDRLDVQRAKAAKLTGQTAGKRSNLGAEMSASPKPGSRMMETPPSSPAKAVTPRGYAKGGKVGCYAKGGKAKHEDVAQDRKLIANMIAAAERKEEREEKEMAMGGKVKNPHKMRRKDTDAQEGKKGFPRHLAAGGAAKVRRGMC